MKHINGNKIIKEEIEKQQLREREENRTAFSCIFKACHWTEEILICVNDIATICELRTNDPIIRELLSARNTLDNDMLETIAKYETKTTKSTTSNPVLLAQDIK